MSSIADLSDIVITTEHQRFAEFCDACRRYAYIGLCYGPPGVGKTLSARHYANWNQIEAYSPYNATSDAKHTALIGSNTVFYTAKVVNSPRQIEQELAGWRLRLRTIPLEALHREEERELERAREQDKPKQLEFALQIAQRNDPVWLNKSAVSTPLKLLRVDVYWAARAYHDLQT